MAARRLRLCILLVTFATLVAGAEEGVAARKRLLFVYTEYAPANYLADDGTHTGFFIDIVREAVSRLGYDLAIAIYPWRRCQNMVESGEADFIVTVATEARLAYSVKVDEPVWVKHYRLYSYEGHPRLAAMDGVRRVEDLKASGFSVVSYIGNGWADAQLKPAGVTVINAVSVEGMYRMLVARRGDLLIEDPLLASNALRGLDLDSSLVLSDGSVGESPFYMLISRRSAFAAEAQALSRILTEMRKDGTIDALSDVYR